jgi:hypothetical protein
LKRRDRTIIQYSDSDENCNDISTKNETLELKVQMLIAIKTDLQIKIPKRNHLENMHFIMEEDWPTSIGHIEKRDQAYLRVRRKDFWKENTRLS